MKGVGRPGTVACRDAAGEKIASQLATHPSFSNGRANRQLAVLAYIIASGALGVAGQLILKYDLTRLGPLSLRTDTLIRVILELVLHPLIVGGLLVYGSGTFLWLLALSRSDLSYAYSFASLNYVVVFLASWWLLGEQPSLSRLVGVGAICAGVWAISRTPAQTNARPDRLTSDQEPSSGQGAGR